MKLITIIGARPQFIKAAPVSRAFAHRQSDVTKEGQVTEIIIHTGQHFDADMSEIFFNELQIPKPDYNLGIGGGSHGQNTGRMIEKIEAVLMDENPDWVIVYGDTDSTLAGALAAGKLHIPVAHIEAGLRSYNRSMPEEINRVMTDHISTLLFCPTQTAVENLKNEGFSPPSSITHSLSPDCPAIFHVGDVMYDAALYYADIAQSKSTILKRLGLNSKNFVLATVHRPGNTDNPEKLTAILEALAQTAVKLPVVLPLHPRTRKRLEMMNSTLIAPGETQSSPHIIVTPPLGYLDMVMLEKNAAVITTDSGGVQKEAYFHRVPCVTLREETEWVELVDMGWNRLASPGEADIMKNIFDAVETKGKSGRPYGDGDAATKIVNLLVNSH